MSENKKANQVVPLDSLVKTGLSRRAFLAGLAGTGAVAALSGLAGCTPAKPAAEKDAAGSDTAKSTAPAKVDKTYDTDLLIVGGGGSGLACAVQAALNGTKFILVEKNSQLGGNASFVEGMFAIGSKMAEAQGIHVTPSEIIEAELVRGQHRQNGALWMDLCAKSAENIDWCLEQGVEYSGKIDNYNGGLYPTFHWFKEGKCAIGYVAPMIKRTEELGVETHLKTAVNSLIIDGSGGVAGAYAEGEEGVVQYNCKAVVFATGGFGGNPELIEKQGWDIENLFVVGSPNAAGDAYSMALEVGAKDFIADSAQSVLYNIPALPPIDFHKDALNPVNGYFGIAAGGPVLWVNENCERFTRENLTDENLVLQCVPGRDNLANYCLFDQAIFDKYFGTTAEGRAMFDKAVAEDSTKTLFKADSIEGLAKALELDATALKTTVARYNELAIKGIDEDYGKPAEKMVPLEQGPFYMAKMGYSYFFEVGGITTDKQRRVLNSEMQPIAGLYAIGNDGNMLYRHVYTINMPGTAFGNQVNSGREAANNVQVFLKG